MRKRTKFAGIAAGMVLMTGVGTTAQASECPDQKIIPAFELTALQTEFMVAALNCGLSDQYNAFVRAYREKLVSSDRTVGQFFKSIHGARGARSHDTYKTKLANDSFIRNIPDFATFCEKAQVAMEDMVENPVKEQATFVTLVSAQPASSYHNMGHCVRGRGAGSDTTSVDVAPKK